MDLRKVVPVEAQEVMDPMAEAVKEGVSSLEGLDAVSKIVDHYHPSLLLSNL